MSGFVFINKVPGNFHISGHHYPEAVKRLFMLGHKLDFTHKINHLSFGDINSVKHIEENFGDKFTWELDGRDIQEKKFVPGVGISSMNMAVNYFLEISQVDYVDQTNPEVEDTMMEAYQFRASQTIKTEPGMPAIFFRYELSPIRIQYTMSLPSIQNYLVRVCAIIGGVYAVSSIIESALRNTLSVFGFGDLSDAPKMKKKVVKRPKPAAAS